MKKLFLIAGTLAASSALQAQTYNITVDATLNKKTISPLIYGVAYASTSQLQDLNSPANRMGGDETSRYNWELNADNRAFDWFFESIGDDNPTAAYRVDSFIQDNKAANAQTLFTVPMIPWIAKLGANRANLWSFSIDKYGPQTGWDTSYPDAGNGISTATGNPFITGNNANDASTPNSVDFETGLFNHLVGKWGTAANGGMKYYEMDNEPSIWYSTHRDVHPVGPKMDEIATDMVNYATAVKTADPTALVTGPEEWGWSGYFYSGYDQQWGPAHNFTGYPDQAAHGGMDYVAYLLQQMNAASTTAGKRLLDVFTLHFYPQDGSYLGSTDPNSAAQQAIRNASTRALWDPTYTDQSWIATDVDLIPRMQEWVNTYYPGTQIGLTEYNWGDEPYINGATAQADVDGILGLYGVNIATRWTTPDPSTPTYKAMKMYRNYDGKNDGFGDVSVSDTGATVKPNNFTSYAATRTADGSLTIMLINKIATTATVNLTVKDFTGNGTAQVWQLTSANAINQEANITTTASTFPVTLPGQSVTLLVLPPSNIKLVYPGIPSDLAAWPLSDEVVLEWDTSANSTSYKVLVSSTSATTGFSAAGTTTANSFAVKSLTNGKNYWFEVEGVNTNGSSSPSHVLEVAPAVPPKDPAQYNFEGSAQGWTDSGGLITNIGPSLRAKYAGAYGLAVVCNATGTADSQNAYVLNPDVKPGATVTFHVLIPTGCGLTSIQPYVLQNSTGGWTWTGTYTALSNIKEGTWNTITVTVPANASTLYSLGVQFNSGTTKWSGVCYIDSVSYN